MARHRTYQAFGAACIVLMAVAGCSSQAFQAQIGDFSSGVQSAVQALELQQEEHRRKREAQLREAITHATRVEFLHTPECSRLQQEYQRIFSAYRKEVGLYLGTGLEEGTTRPAPQLARISLDQAGRCKTRVVIDGSEHALDPDPLLEQTLQLAREMNRYATALAALASAEDEAAFSAAASQLNGSLSGVIGRMQPGTPLGDRLGEQQQQRVARAQAAFGPIASLLQHSLLTALEQKKYRVLRQVVGQLDPVVEAAAAVIAQNSLALSRIGVNDLSQAYLRSLEGASQADGAQRLERLDEAEQQRRALIEAVTASPAEAFHRMATAHHALRMALKDRKTDLSQLLQEMGDFAQQAGNAYQALQSQP